MEKIYQARLKGEILRFPSEDPTRLSYRIREAIVTARRHDDYKHYGRLQPFVKVCKRDDEVIIKWKDIDILPDEERQLKREDVDTRPTDIEAEALFDIIGTMIRNESKPMEEVNFPNVVLERDDMIQLFNWAEGKGWKMIDNEGAGLTLTKLDVDEELLWKPEDAEDE